MFTGKVTYQRLLKVYKGTTNPVLDSNGSPVIKNNSVDDPDYISPRIDLVLCGNPTTQTTNTSSTSSSTNTTTIIPPVVNCNDLVSDNYSVDCSSILYNTVTFNIGTNALYVTIEIHQNNNIVDIKENLLVIGGQVTFQLPKANTGVLTFVVYSLICRKEFNAAISCPTTTTSTTSTSTSSTSSTTSTSNTTTGTSTSTSSSTSSSTGTTTSLCQGTINIGTITGVTIAISTTTTSTTNTTTQTTNTSTSSSTSSTTQPVGCNGTFTINSPSPCGSGTFSVIVNKTSSGTLANLVYGYSNTNDPSTVTNWQSSNFLIVTGDGLTKYIFVKYGASSECQQFVSSVVKDCSGSSTTTNTTTSSTSTTTLGGNVCDGKNVIINSLTKVDANHLSVILTTVGITFFRWRLYDDGFLVDQSTTNVASNPYNIFNTFTMIVGRQYVFYAFPEGCGEGIPYTFTYNGEDSRCSESNSPQRIAIDLRTASGTGLSYDNLAFAVLAACGPSRGCVAYVNNLSVGQQVFMNTTLPDCVSGNCLPAPTGYYWTYAFNNQPYVVAIHIDNNGFIDVLQQVDCGSNTTTVTSSTTTTTLAGSGCSGATNLFVLQGQNPGGTSFVSFAAALAASCSVGQGGTLYYVGQPSMGKRPYTNTTTCNLFSGNGYYWTYQFNNPSNAYIVHFTNGTIDQIQSKTC